jgi:hypothetical protein
MKALLAATIVVHYLGLAVVTDQVTNDCGVHIIVPRVKYEDMSWGRPIDARDVRPQTLLAPPRQGPDHQQRLSRSDAGGQEVAQLRTPDPRWTVLPRQGPQVEDHLQIIIIPRANYHPSSSWKGKPFPLFPNDYVYFELVGDHIRFLTEGVKNPKTDVSNVRLPRIKTCCTTLAGRDLLPAYQAPYKGAAGVFDITEGVLTSCKIDPADAKSRYDSELTLEHNGNFVIDASTMTQDKRIRLFRMTPDTAVLVANVPTCKIKGNCVEKAHHAADGLPHYRAMYAMAEGGSTCNTSLADCAPVAGACKVTYFAGTGKKQLGIEEALAMTFECSNSQWP